MGANTKSEQVAKSEEDLNKRLLYRAYDLILSWPIEETAVALQQAQSDETRVGNE